jgi:hypothetical protein
MEEMNINEMKELIMNYVIKEYIDDDDVKITYETPLISSGYVDSFSMVSLWSFLKTNSGSRSLLQRQPRKPLTASTTLLRWSISI